MPKLDQTLVNWQVAPAEHEIANYDEPKFRYRRYVEEFVKPLTVKSLRKKTFYTISSNVLCADVNTSKDTIDPIERDIYLPLEIALTKWSISDAKIQIGERQLETKLWMINPGPPTRLCNKAAMDNQKKHKIDFDIEVNQVNKSQNQFIEEDLSKIMKEINSFLSADRTVFSLSLKHVRQDLGSLKWLNLQTDCKSKPIVAYSLEDLYVVLIKKFSPDFESCQGIAEYRLTFKSDSYDSSLQCHYHRVKSNNEEDGDTQYCAQGLAKSYSNVMIDDLNMFAQPI